MKKGTGRREIRGRCGSWRKPFGRVADGFVSGTGP